MVEKIKRDNKTGEVADSDICIASYYHHAQAAAWRIEEEYVRLDRYSFVLLFELPRLCRTNIEKPPIGGLFYYETYCISWQQYCFFVPVGTMGTYEQNPRSNKWIWPHWPCFFEGRLGQA